MSVVERVVCCPARHLPGSAHRSVCTDSGVKCKLMPALTYTYSHVEDRCLAGATTVTRCAIPARVETALGLEPGHAPVERPVCNYKVKNTFLRAKFDQVIIAILHISQSTIYRALMRFQRVGILAIRSPTNFLPPLFI